MRPVAETVRDDRDASRYVLDVDGTQAGYAEYHRHRDVIAFIHTVIDPAYEGRGLASTLIRYALDDARAQGLAVQPFCPFVRAYISRHDEYRDLVPRDEWERFGLG
jgi:predicted GNAT family acetyltransferase